jgi:hypothetical protein
MTSLLVNVLAIIGIAAVIGWLLLGSVLGVSR